MKNDSPTVLKGFLVAVVLVVVFLLLANMLLPALAEVLADPFMAVLL